MKNDFDYVSHALASSQANEPLYLDFRDRQLHAAIIRTIAEDTERSIGEIEPLYEEVLAHMRSCATVTDYLPILVSKKVKNFYLSRH